MSKQYTGSVSALGPVAAGFIAGQTKNEIAAISSTIFFENISSPFFVYKYGAMSACRYNISKTLRTKIELSLHLSNRPAYN